MPDDRERRAQAKKFLILLMELACEEGYYFVIYSLPSRRSKFFNKIDQEVLDYIFRECDDNKQNVYVGMGIFKRPIKGGGRGTQEEVDGLVCYFGDFDTRKSPDDEFHPETIDECLELAKIGGTGPSFYVLSGGGGCHPYWPYKEILIWKDQKERGDAIDRVRRVNETLRAMSEERGYKLDHMKDIARVFRVPGTKNYKNIDNVTDVQLVENLNSRGEIDRYEPDDFDAFLVALEVRGLNVAGQHSEKVGYLDLDPGARINSENLKLAIEADDRFRDTWLMRRGKEFGDDVSSYDQSIANTLIDAGWTDQQVADAITHFRRDQAMKPKVDPKGRLRLDYYQKTIFKAKTAMTSRKGKDAIESGSSICALPVDEKSGAVIIDNTTRDRISSDLRSVLRVDIRRFIQIGLDDAQYWIEVTGSKKLLLGDDDVLESFKLFRRRLRTNFGILVDASAQKLWESVLAHLIAIRELDLSVNPTKTDRLYVSLAAYCREAHVMNGDGARGRAVGRCAPFREEGDVFIHFETYEQWSKERRERLFNNTNEGVTMFKFAGASRIQIIESREGSSGRNRARRWYWRFNWESIHGSGVGPHNPFEGVEIPDGVDDATG